MSSRLSQGSDARHRPVFCPAPGHAGLETQCLPHFPLRGVRNDRAFHRARGATCGEARGSRAPKHTAKQAASDAAHTPRVPHANGFRGLLHVPGGVATADAFPFVRTVARTCTWAVRPCCRRLSLIVASRIGDPESNFKGPASWRPPHPAIHVTKTIATRPVKERDGQ